VLRGPKDDERDAFDIAARVQVGHWPDSYVPDDFWQGLRRLTRYRFKLSRSLSQEKMRFRSYAFLKCSDWKRVKAFSDLFGTTSVALLTEFTAAELREMTHDQLADLIARRGRGRFYDPDATARTVQQALHTSYPIDPQMDMMVTATLATGWEHIRAIKRLMKRLDQQISRCIEPVPNPIITVKGKDWGRSSPPASWPRSSTSLASLNTSTWLNTLASPGPSVPAAALSLRIHA